MKVFDVYLKESRPHNINILHLSQRDNFCVYNKIFPSSPEIAPQLQKSIKVESEIHIKDELNGVLIRTHGKVGNEIFLSCEADASTIKSVSIDNEILTCSDKIPTSMKVFSQGNNNVEVYASELDYFTTRTSDMIEYDTYIDSSIVQTLKQSFEYVEGIIYLIIEITGVLIVLARAENVCVEMEGEASCGFFRYCRFYDIDDQVLGSIDDMSMLELDYIEID